MRGSRSLMLAAPAGSRGRIAKLGSGPGAEQRPPGSFTRFPARGSTYSSTWAGETFAAQAAG